MTGDFMVSPASGKVLKSDRNLISIFMRIYDDHINVAPFDGIVSEIKYERGGFLPAFLKRSERNERNIIELATPHGVVKIAQVAGFLIRRIRCDVRVGERVKQGQPLGKIYFGSRVDVTLPEGFSPVVKRGQRVEHGRTIIARRGALDGTDSNTTATYSKIIKKV
ncbi:phosphatidylserine decarboxylase [Candidatus Alkanophaga liquidiphilum]|nr:Phosphatidylserine decarboxylase [Candidatus Alkanophaga liquidiphilum]RLG38449.1 MAG: phosphatidylserine decarboxylase family protein [Candidatus Alkanophagales archaeon]